jgi:hypothetical protein
VFFGEEDAAEDVFFGVLEIHFVPEIFGVTAAGVGLADGAEFGSGVAAEAVEVAHQETAFYFYMVELLEMRPVFEHGGGEIAVIGEEKDPAGVVVEAADGIDAFGQALEAISQGLAAFGVGHGGDHFGRFIENDVNAALVVFDEFAGGFDAVCVGVGFAAEFGDYLAVDSDLSADDELFGMPAGGDAGSGDYFL